ncbi:hypothetical protein ASG89_21815 [Paenibacillus sp. Soil766]|uniref:DUF2334 domain-containing protein n=1 Tax=Paenibacillus sp. Soil766 TaxID=1736404 RepID=UPI00070A4DFA|nr:DUF2334 domain-containing protein [Paenibacillus sp. Soil766]KRF04486.1 hypothetical protein ASG89_21815 [Paenibacillus sp. Soil766]
MKRKLWQQIGIGIVGGIIAAIALAAYIPSTTETNNSPNMGKRHAMIRLEDVGLGGDYNTLEGLGKLRAVMTYLESEHVPFHVAVIPRRMSLQDDGVWKEKGIDDPNPDEVVSAFIKLLQQAEHQGGVLGMHGYRHQYGETYRSDGEQNSGIGSEFNIKDAPETQELSYAAERMKESLAAFAGADLHPAFWESPHYKDTHEQQGVFRSFVGLMYQPDLYAQNAREDMNAYDTINTYGQDSLGSVYIPAPYRYISDAQSVDQMLEKAAKDDGLASFYFHPFLEFSHLEPVMAGDGNPEEKDGIPIYQYKEGDNTSSYLHKLLTGFKKLDYRWMSLHDIVPFTPAHRVMLPPRTRLQNVMLGDVTGRGHADVVVRQLHRVLVIPGNYDMPRNRQQEASQVWLRETFSPDESLLLVDVNGDGKQDLLAYNTETGNVRVAIADKRQFLPVRTIGALPLGLSSVRALRSRHSMGLIAKGDKGLVQVNLLNQQLTYTESNTKLPEDTEIFTAPMQDTDEDDDIVCVSHKDRRVSIMYHQGQGGFSEPQTAGGVSFGDSDQLLVGDTNGDGRGELIAYTAETGIWRVFQNEGENHFQPLDNEFGPWAKGKERRAMVADFDGNRKLDIGSYNETEHVLDLALSFRSGTP